MDSSRPTSATGSVDDRNDPRDGQQGGLPLTTAQSLRIYDILCRFAGISGAIQQAEFFVYHPLGRAALEGALERYQDGAPIEPTT